MGMEIPSRPMRLPDYRNAPPPPPPPPRKECNYCGGSSIKDNECNGCGSTIMKKNKCSVMEEPKFPDSTFCIG